MKAFISGTENKESAIARARALRESDAFYGWGHFWHEGKGNVSGGMYHSYLKPGETEQDVLKYPEPVHGIPVSAAKLFDYFFSGLCIHDKEIAKAWAETVYEAIRPGADLSQLSNKIILHVLETPELLAEYADGKGAHLVGVMQGIYILRGMGINQDKRLIELHYDHLYKLHRHQLDGKHDTANYVMAALKALSSTPISGEDCGAVWYFLNHAMHGAAANKKRGKHGEEWYALSKVLIQKIKDC